MLELWGSSAQAAIIDFTFNLGIGRLQSSTLRKRINSDNIDGAKIELGKWVRGGGRILPGLVKRRAAEAALLG
jgi:lysozyme